MIVRARLYPRTYHPWSVHEPRQCDHTLEHGTVPKDSVRWRRVQQAGLDPRRCTHPAVYLVGVVGREERKLCSWHAGRYALTLALGEGEKT